METIGLGIVIVMLICVAGALFCCYLSDKMLREVDIHLAKRFEPPPHYVSAAFLIDEELGGNYFEP
jgi:hypothetical protein